MIESLPNVYKVIFSHQYYKMKKMNEYIKPDMLTSLSYLPLQSMYLDSILYFLLFLCFILSFFFLMFLFCGP